MNKPFSYRKSLSCAIRAAITASVFALPMSVIAQETSSSLKGVVADESGQPLSGSTVTVVNEDTALSRTVETNESGEFTIRNLQVGDNYTVTVQRSGFSGESA